MQFIELHVALLHDGMHLALSLATLFGSRLKLLL